MAELTAATEKLVGWAVPGRGITARGVGVKARGGSWEFVDYDELGRRVRVIAHLVRDRVEHGAVVTILTSSPHDLITSLFGVIFAGGVPAVLPTPRLFEPTTTYVDRVSRMVATSRAQLVLGGRTLRDAAERITTECDVRTFVAEDALRAQPELDAPIERAPSDPAILQFTSGSSGPQRGVSLSRHALTTHLEALLGWLVADPANDVSLSWLPPHHDMGLVGLIVLPVVNQTHARLLSPEEFVQKPLSWLEAIDHCRATLGASPPFGLEHCAKALARSDGASFDLSSMRRLVVGAERVNAGTLERFADLTRRFGFNAAALLPAYGLAEATLGATGTIPTRRPTKLRVRGDTLTLGRRVHIEASAQLFADGDGDWLVGCGEPLPGVTLEILDEGDRPCEEEVLGRIVVTGPAIASGYLTEDGFETPWPAGGPLDTGDAGFLRSGELFVIGRQGDALKVRGRSVFAEGLEASIAELPGSPRRMVVVAGTLRGRDTVVVVCEGRSEEGWSAAASKLVRAELNGVDVDAVIALVPPKSIEYTSSGKPRRRPLWAGIASGAVKVRPMEESK